MKLEEFKKKIIKKKFSKEVDKYINDIIERLGELEEKGELRLWELGDHEWDTFVDELEELGLVKTYERKGKTFYKATEQGKKLYQELESSIIKKSIPKKYRRFTMELAPWIMETHGVSQETAEHMAYISIKGLGDCIDIIVSKAEENSKKTGRSYDELLLEYTKRFSKIVDENVKEMRAKQIK